MASLTERLTVNAILFDSTRPVQSAQSFGRGLPRRPFVPDLDDLAWAVQAFGDAESDRHLEALAEQARWDDQFNRTFPAGCCQLCGEPSDQLDPVHELCPECLTAAENATIACQKRTAMGQYRVF
jgi:hypothetical protein